MGKGARQVRTVAADDPRGSVPSFAFDPADPWTVTFQAGLRRAGLGGRRVYEIGVGSGANILFMLRQCAASLVAGSDLDPRLPPLAQRLVADSAPELLDRVRVIEAPVSLIDAPAAMAEAAIADVFVGCLPQVPDPCDAMYARFHAAQLNTPVAIEPRMDDHIAHYYPWAAFNAYPFNSVGLGLIEALLRRVRSSVPQAEVVLTLGCRIGKDVLARLFRANRYWPEELISRIVRQDEHTDISFFVALEMAMQEADCKERFECAFYGDPVGRLAISAREAKKRLSADPPAPVFHEICVLRGHPMITSRERPC
jgi:hypothetical protein